MSNERERNNSDIWSILLKKVSGTKLSEFTVLDKKDDSKLSYQIFEVLIAETLNMCDRNTKWTVTPCQADQGIDLKGLDSRIFSTPFVPTPTKGLSLGQIKRRASGHKFDHFIYDLNKINDYCFKNNIYDECCLVQIVYVLSSDKLNDVKNIQTKYSEAVKSKNIQSININHNSKLNIINANDLIKIWKIHRNSFLERLSNALSKSELDVFDNYLDSLDLSLVKIRHLKKTNRNVYVNEIFTEQINISSTIENLDLTLYVKWHNSGQDEIQFIHPLAALDPRKTGYKISIKQNAVFSVNLRCLKEGYIDCGTLEFFSSSNECIASIKLDTVNANYTFSTIFSTTNNQNLINNIENRILLKEQKISVFRIVGNGGIGKSTIINEVMIHIANKEFMCISLAHKKDKIHNRTLIRNLFKEFIYPNKDKIVFSDSIPNDIREYLSVMYIEKWHNSLINYFSGEDTDCNIKDIAECLTSIIISELQEQNIFIWLSDMHWASVETFTILKNLIDCLNENQTHLKNNLRIIIEGRSHEALIVSDTVLIPSDWEYFYSNSDFIEYTIDLWDELTSIDYLKKIFKISSADEATYLPLFKQLISYSCGNPMHLNEHIRMLIESHYLYFDKSVGIRIERTIPDEILSNKILELIKERILFYTNKYPYLMDALVAIASADIDIPKLLQNKIFNWLEKKNSSIKLILKQSGFAEYEDNNFKFIHEHYLNAFKEEQIKSDELIELILDFYGHYADKSYKDELILIRIKLMYDKCDYEQLYEEIVSLIKKSSNIWITYELYSYLLKIAPNNKSENYIPEYKIYFELCECLIRFGSWEKANENLEKALSTEIDYNNPEKMIYILKAYQEVSNVQCDQMKFDSAIKTAEEGIEIAEVCLSQSCLINYIDEIQRLLEKLQARLAVCHWFTFDIKKASVLQEECMESARERGDLYSENHVKYEYGTLQFHFNVDEGISNMEKVLKDIKDIPELKKHEETLIKVQLLIGKVIKANNCKDKDLLKSIKLETRRLIDYYNYNPHTYEEFLCYTIRGCIFVLSKKNEDAYQCFAEALKRANMGEMPNLEWKAYYNLAQYYLLINDKQNAYLNSDKSLKILENAFKNNPKYGSLFKTRIHFTERHLKSIKNFDKNNYVEGIDNLLSISYKGLNFIIMN